MKLTRALRLPFVLRLLTLGITFTFSLILSTQVHALKSDRDQPAQIEADETEIDFKTGVRTLTTNVLVVQGTLRLKADKLVATYDKKGQLVKAVADGSLARFKQRPDDQPDDVEGWAKKIVVDYPTNTLTLIGKAALKQGETTGRGERIIYNMATDKLKIQGDSNVATAGKPGTKKPARKIEDPFKDDADGPPEATSKTTNKKTKKSGEKASQKTEPEVAPVKAGRSRLILQPKKVKKKDDKKKDNEENDGEEKDDDKEDK